MMICPSRARSWAEERKYTVYLPPPDYQTSQPSYSALYLLHDGGGDGQTGWMSGIGARTVQRWMGHRSLTTTDKYAHVSPDHEKAAIQRLRYESGHQVGTGTDSQ